MNFNSGLAAKQRENRVTESGPSSNITLGLCAILLWDFCDMSQVSNAPKENRTLGRVLVLERNTHCNLKSKILW